MQTHSRGREYTRNNVRIDGRGVFCGWCHIERKQAIGSHPSARLRGGPVSKHVKTINIAMGHDGTRKQAWPSNN
jgi:hypothetical protein